MSLNRSLMLLLAVAAPSAVFAQISQGFTPPGPNVALGKSYTLEPDPNYHLCTDEGDLVQLTDGILAPHEKNGAPSSMWGFEECVGWTRARHVTITFDLEEPTPIAGMALSTEAGHAGVGWPGAVVVAVSLDGEQFHVAGELMSLSARHGLPPGSGRHVFVTDSLLTQGRFVRLGILPAGPYTFADEIEIYRGPDALLEQPLSGDPVGNMEEYLENNRVPLAVRTWVSRDLARARAELAASSAPRRALQRVGATLERVERDNQALIAPPGDGYRAVFPLTSTHGQLFRALGSLRGAEGHPALQLWKNNRWDALTLWSRPSQAQLADVSVDVRMIRNERRAETFNVSNNSHRPVRARVWVEGLPGGTAPDYISLREVLYVAMPSGRWDANALPEAALEDGRWEVTLLPGIAQQLWFAFHPQADFPTGTHRGRLVIEPERGARLHVPLNLAVEPVQYPDEHTLAFGMWDYTDGRGTYGLHPGNLPAAVEHMQSYGYNTPWAHPGTVPWVGPGAFNAEDEFTGELNLERFDAWTAMWPNAKYYAVYANVGNSFAGAVAGTEQFDRRLASWMRAWADAILERGIDLERIVILLVDEPGGGASDERQLRWSLPVQQAVPELQVFTDPVHYDPHLTGLREMFEAADIICPEATRYWDRGQVVWDFYEELRAGGRQLWLYKCGAGPSSASPIAYHRAQQWMLWPMKGTGTMFWSYGDVGRAPGGSWNTLAATGEIFAPAYIDADSVTDGKHWLAIIEGIQDYEYLRMLRDRIAELEAAGVQSRALHRARELLETLPQEAIEAANGGDTEVFDRARLRVLDALVDLR